MKGAATRSDDDPVVPGPIYGVRAWEIGAGGKLIGRGGFKWETGGQNTTAECGISPHLKAGDGSPGGHIPPGRDCMCGLYALHAWQENLVDLARQSDPAIAIGLVEAVGQVEVHADGFRAESAKPIALLVPYGAGSKARKRIGRVAERHRAETIELDRVGISGLISWSEEQAPALSRGYVEELHPKTTRGPRLTAPYRAYRYKPIHPTLRDVFSWRRILESAVSGIQIIGYGIGLMIMIYLHLVILVVAVVSALWLVDAVGLVDTGLK